MAKFIIEWTVMVTVEAENHEAADNLVSEWTIFDALDHNATVTHPTAAVEGATS